MKQTSDEQPRIGIAGAGGLGSNIAAHLMRSGVNSIKIVDFDRIETGNLNRQFFFKDQIGRIKVEALYDNLIRINPVARIEICARRLSGDNMVSLFADCPILIEALDGRRDKAELLCHNLGEGIDKRLIVAASGVAGYRLENLTIRQPRRNLFIVGDFTTSIDQQPTYSTMVQTAAAMMANIVLEQGGFYDG